MSDPGRILVWFSCGAASAVAAKLTSEKYPSCELVYCDTLINEHPDNLRFIRDVEGWTGKTVRFINSKTYESVDHVIQIRKYMSGIAGAPCTVELKKIPRFRFQLAGDLHLFGLTADEKGRIRKFEKANSDIDLEWILVENGITHAECLKILVRAGIEVPAMYKLGFRNNNCIGCVKATSPAYWVRIRKFFPEVFEKRCKQSRKLRVKLLRLRGERVFLDQLPVDFPLDEDDSESIECGVLCSSEAR